MLSIKMDNEACSTSNNRWILCGTRNCLPKKKNEKNTHPNSYIGMEIIAMRADIQEAEHNNDVFGLKLSAFLFSLFPSIALAAA